VLQNNSENNLPINANGAFTFTTSISSGGAYSVTISAQPSSPAQACTVANGSGTVRANITNVQVTCTMPSYTVGGTVTGLSGSGLVLQDNGSDNLAIDANGNFTFVTVVPSGGKYDATVLTEPSNPVQLCAVTNGSGTVNANVTSIVVTCTTPSPKWTWVGGSDHTNQPGIYGTRGMADRGNFPGARSLANYWTDSAGNFWLFGGSGYASTSTTDILNDLWKYSAGEWTWVGGSNLGNQSGIYGTLGVAAPQNTPGARVLAVSWIDPSGNFWLFGGTGTNSIGVTTFLNDLWIYSSGEWTWESGSNIGEVALSCGAPTTPAQAPNPGFRENSISGVDLSGNLWLFGGYGCATDGTFGVLSDLWKYSAGKWTFVGGSTTVNQPAVYGTLGISAAANTPGSRSSSASWTDASGNLWLFGGGIYSPDFDLPLFQNDLWKLSAGEWTWMGGSSLPNQPGVYGLLGVAAPGNVPGARQNAVSGTNDDGNFRLFGGIGDTTDGVTDDFSDVWKYSDGEWTWVAGPNLPNLNGTYGVPGSAASNLSPGSRSGAAGWTDPAGNLWIFGGFGFDSTGAYSYLNDLWKLEP
jgi:N-acetylneuraminic acid mutarotase